MKSGTEAATVDAGLCARLREGEVSAVRELLAREYPVALFFAQAVAGDDGAEGVVAEACARLLADVRQGVVSGGLRAALLRRVALILPDADAAGVSTPSAPLRTFVAAGDRWAGWWDIEPPPWPPSVVLQPEQVLRALRRLPRAGRILLVLRDVAGLGAEDAEAVFGAGPDRHAMLLELARDAYLVELDREVGGV